MKLTRCHLSAAITTAIFVGAIALAPAADAACDNCGTVVGAGAGAYAGHQVEKNQKSSTNYQVIVKMEDGKSRTFNFSKETSYRSGDKIKVVDGKLVKQ